MCEKGEFKNPDSLTAAEILLVGLEDKQYEKIRNHELEIADLLSSYLECTRIVKVISFTFEYS